MHVRPFLPCKTFDFYHLLQCLCVCKYLCTYYNSSKWVYMAKSGIDHPPQLSGRHHLYTNTSTSYSTFWLIPICCVSVFHLCCQDWMGGICHIVIFLLLTSQFIRWLLGPWWTWVFSLSSRSLFSSPYLSANSKKTFNRKTKKINHRKPFLIKKRVANDKKGSTSFLCNRTKEKRGWRWLLLN